jgi:type II secretory pathway component PulJ
MMGTGGILGVLVAVSILAAAFGVAYAVFTSARVRTTIEVYEKENAAQGKRIDTLEKDAEVAATRIKALEEQNTTLRDLATGKTAIEAFALVYERTQHERASEHQSVLKMLEGIYTRLMPAGQ